MKAQAESRVVETIKKHALKGDYRAGLEVARQALERDPKSFVIRYQFAKMLGDWADELPEARRKKLKREATAILARLKRSLKGQPADVRFGLCLNYYYQSADFRGMHAFGARLSAKGERNGSYAMGIGATLLAQGLAARGRESEALRWARKGEAAWKRYGLKGEKYYFPHYVQGLALAIQGKQEARAALDQAAKASKRSISHEEFADLRQLIAERGKGA